MKYEISRNTDDMMLDIMFPDGQDDEQFFDYYELEENIYVDSDSWRHSLHDIIISGYRQRE